MHVNSVQQLKTDLRNELVTSNQLLRQIGEEIQEIKQLTRSGGELETNITRNASLMESLASLQQLALENLPARARARLLLDINDHNQNVSINGHNESSSSMDESP